MSNAAITIIPLGAHEQHGPHLPFETDALIASGVMQRTLAKAADLNLHVMPAEPVGYSPEHMRFEGSRTLGWSEAIIRWIGLGEQAIADGSDRIVFMNAHGGNVPLVQIVCQELRSRHAVLAVSTKWDRFTRGYGIVSQSEEALGIHGGEIETAVMLALHPELVDMSKAVDFPNLQSRLTGPHLRAYGPHSFGWMMGDLNPDGVAGNSAAATAETGEKLLDIASDGLLALLHEVADFDLSLLKD
ncbi:creatininase family protein [Ahrensia sp. R2A130]|uniref:creatininase family protein n=1 Tax=Ahrensia sp. R2A130 TaxID=744979 RepID=UPI0001E0BC90|nr:creatininase family protein [Ahrensia sp. R2A130]EFL88753.1 creatininase [Ahrensia sp. R2A130]